MPPRVISGRAKGRKLRLVPGDSTRPIMDRVKENLFNIIGREVIGQRWLDLFAGTGQVGIEALSRGADSVLFVDNNRAAIKTIQANLESTGLTEGARVVQTDAFALLRSLTNGRFDVLYVAPPQYKSLWKDVLAVVDEEPERFLVEDGQVIVQIDPLEYESLPLARLTLYDERRYGNTLLAFYEIVRD